MNLNQIRPYLPYLLLNLKKKIKPLECAEDAYQEILIYLHLKDDIIIQYPKTYLYNLAKWYSYKKKTYLHTELVDNINYKQNIIFSSESGRNTNHIDDRLLNRLESISNTLYKPFIMQIYDNMSIKQIALELNSNENTIKTRIKRAKEYLRN
jgi:DNA-directed RNA polymerase specialized sigma24 family protein